MEKEDELNLDNLEAQADKKLEIKNRYQQLSEKVKLTSQEKDELAKAKTALEADKESLSKERDFYKGSSALIAKYPSASEFQDKIWEKVKAGYEIEDATVSVLNKEGKLSAPPPEPKPRMQVEGGSAPTAFEGEKKPTTRKEMRNALVELDKQGELVKALLGR